MIATKNHPTCIKAAYQLGNHTFFTDVFHYRCMVGMTKYAPSKKGGPDVRLHIRLFYRTTTEFSVLNNLLKTIKI